MSTEKADPWAAVKEANRARADAWDGEPEPEPEEELMATFKATLPPTTVMERWALSAFLDETATRTVSDIESLRTADWERALVAVLRDLAAAAREAKGQKVASAQESVDVSSPVTLSARVSLNKAGREKLHKVLKVARKRVPDGPAGAAAVALADQFEKFVYGPDGEPQEPPRRGPEPPGLWTEHTHVGSDLVRFQR